MWAGDTQWLCQWEALKGEVDKSPVWKTKDWLLLLNIARKTKFQKHWVQSHAKDNKSATN